MESHGMSVIKYLLFLFNLLFAISGIGIIVAGGLVLSDSDDFGHFEDGNNFGPSIVLIVAGAIVFIVAFLGCFGAIRESYGMLMAFAVCLLIIFILELAAGIAAAVNRSEMTSEKFQESRSKYSSSDKEKMAWDKLQEKLHCCGVNGPSEWGSGLPYSCCRETPEKSESENTYCVQLGKGNKYLSTMGCFEKLKMGVATNSKAIIGVGIGIAFIEIIGIVLACWLAAVIKRESATEK